MFLKKEKKIISLTKLFCYIFFYFRPSGSNMSQGYPGGPTQGYQSYPQYPTGPPAGQYPGGPPGGQYPAGQYPEKAPFGGPPPGPYPGGPPAGQYSGGPPAGQYSGGPPPAGAYQPPGNFVILIYHLRLNINLNSF